jgi:hypothetical protein
VGKLEGKRPLGIPRYWCMDNINMDLGETGWGTQDRGKWGTGGPSSSAQLHRVS